MATVKVRIAVAVRPNGVWSAEGRSNWSGDFAMRIATASLPDFATHYWLTAELPIPEPQTIEATVEPQP